MQHKNANVTIRLQEDISTLARASKEDSEVIRNIAIENKKDGASMKTIAILGMIFLPGTFLAV
jgi:Mg2+ and Co2+ transporter CorA